LSQLSSSPKSAGDERELVVESGPVDYAGPDQTAPINEEVGEEDDDFDEDEEDVDHVSAAQLFGQMYNNGELVQLVSSLFYQKKGPVTSKLNTKLLFRILFRIFWMKRFYFNLGSFDGKGYRM
jgi:hypothetical protein